MKLHTNIGRELLTDQFIVLERATLYQYRCIHYQSAMPSAIVEMQVTWCIDAGRGGSADGEHFSEGRGLNFRLFFCEDLFVDSFSLEIAT